jgi:hypothetical protein
VGSGSQSNESAGTVESLDPIEEDSPLSDSVLTTPHLALDVEALIQRKIGLEDMCEPEVVIAERRRRYREEERERRRKKREQIQSAGRRIWCSLRQPVCPGGGASLLTLILVGGACAFVGGIVLAAAVHGLHALLHPASLLACEHANLTHESLGWTKGWPASLLCAIVGHTPPPS